MSHEHVKLSMGFLKEALRGKAKIISTKFDPSVLINQVCSDTRRVKHGDVFVALRGDTHDGHEFIGSAVEKGAIGIICEKYPTGVRQDGIDIFLVENSLHSFRALARHWRETIDPVVIAVAGSVGKTTTKDLIAAILTAKFKNLVWTKGSENGFVGLPISLMRIEPDTEAAVIEVGIDAPGNMIQHIDLVRPEVAVVTAISEEHLEWLKDLPTIAKEENLILEETARAGGVCVINLDDPWISPLMQSITSASKIGFTLGGMPGPHICAGTIDGKTIHIEGLGTKRFTIESPLPGEHNARNLVCAVAVALIVGATPDEIEEGLTTFAPSGGRSQLEILPSGAKVLCDFYNANPASMRAAFQVGQSHTQKNCKLWLCLGDMKELGSSEEALHRGLARDVLQFGDNVAVLLFGDKMKWLADELTALPTKIQVAHFNSQQDLASALKSQVASNDFVVIKGSRSMHMEKVWESLRN